MRAQMKSKFFVVQEISFEELQAFIHAITLPTERQK